jgi:hypothetical protein
VSTVTVRRAASSSALERPRGGRVAPRHSGPASSPSEHHGASGEPTLDELLVGAWERLTGRAAVDCLLCGGSIEPDYSAHALPVGGRCRDCGTALS